MKGMVRLAIVIAVSQWNTGCAQTDWPYFMPSLDPGASTSPVPAVLPQDVAVEPPAPNLPADKARWSGSWRGWACREQRCETRLVVEKVSLDGAAIVYAFASAKRSLVVERVKAKFVEEELYGTLSSGSKLRYRFRKSGDIEFLYRRDDQIWEAGVLSKEK